MINEVYIQKLTPVRQGILAFAIGLIGILFCKLVSKDPANQFMLAFTGIVFYALMNPIISIFNASFAKYVWPSWGVFALLAAALLLCARYISGDSIQQHNEFIKIWISVLMFYIVLSVMVRLVRTMWEFAEDDEN